MTTILIAITATGLGAVLGLLTRHLLASLSYRLNDEQELPHPGRRSWLIIASAISLGSISAWLVHTDNLTLAPTVLPLTLTAPALAAIDLDVMRLPNRILGPVAGLTLAGLAIDAALRGSRDVALQSAAGAVLAGVTFALLNIVSRGGVGFGDVKLAAVVGLATGAVSLMSVWWAVAVGTLLALIWRKISRRTGPSPFGPWLLLGAWVGVLIGDLPRVL
jgi:leader peptidase (prepilin peptidase)/N-methyltransferase